MISSAVLLIRSILLGACDIYVACILIYILMSWLPNHQNGIIGDIYRALGSICEPFLGIFRRIIPPIGGMLDISPIFAIIVVQLIGRLIAALLQKGRLNMAITMQDIQEEGFEHSLRGYDVGQVDEFLERVANEVDAMNKQIESLESQLRDAKKELALAQEKLEEGENASASPEEIEKASLVERELRSELEIAQGKIAAAIQRAEEAEAKLVPMQEQLDEKKALDNTIAEAFISAQRSAAQIKEDAREEGDRIYRESEAKAREFIRESLAKKAAIDNEVKALAEYTQKFREQYLEMLERFTAHAKEEFSNIDVQGVTDAQVEAELPKIDQIKVKPAQHSMPEFDEDELPRLTTQQIPQINIPSIMSDDNQ